MDFWESDEFTEEFDEFMGDFEYFVPYAERVFAIDGRLDQLEHRIAQLEGKPRPTFDEFHFRPANRPNPLVDAIKQTKGTL